MPATIAGALLGPDTHANRPAANAAGQPIGALYSCTTHNLIYRTDGATWATYATVGGGTLSDHTHAVTGSGATGGGATLDPVNLNLATGAPGTTDGRVGWDATLRSVRAYDSVQAKHVTPIGWAPYATSHGVSPFNEFNVGSASLTAVSAGNGGALGMWIELSAPMKLESYALWNADASLARAAEARLYVDRLNSSTTLNFVAGTDATWSFTPGAASRRVSSAVSGAPVYLPPGWYFLVVRNTSATNAFAIGRTTAATNALVVAVGAQLTTASIAALGSTFDITTLTTKSGGLYGVMMLGRIGGQSTAW